jgi:hypothetical protein
MFTKVEDIKNFVLAGNATVTLESMVTEAHLTYKVTQAKDKATGELRDFYFVALLNGPDNESDYAYMGMINGKGEFHLTKNSKFTEEVKSVKAFKFFWKYISEDMHPPQMKIHHEGKCGRCGRKLTVPSSILNGLGPECLSKMGV